MITRTILVTTVTVAELKDGKADTNDIVLYGKFSKSKFKKSLTDSQAIADIQQVETQYEISVDDFVKFGKEVI